MNVEARDWDILEPGDLDRIQEDPAVLFGKPTLRGTRVSVTQVLSLLAEVGSVSEATRRLAEIAPSITAADVQAALRFAAVVCDRRLLVQPGIRATDGEQVQESASADASLIPPKDCGQR
ncbi:MAG: DUF433 domain-containing protein [Firmicutes bacterium]|nr:DUF433 domain-containing protein [Bacillota bacterium]